MSPRGVNLVVLLTLIALRLHNDNDTVDHGTVYWDVFEIYPDYFTANSTHN